MPSEIELIWKALCRLVRWQNWECPCPEHRSDSERAGLCDSTVRLHRKPLRLVALEQARTWMEEGAREIGGNNRGPWVAKFFEPWPWVEPDPSSRAWCAAFVWSCVLEALKSRWPDDAAPWWHLDHDTFPPGVNARWAWDSTPKEWRVDLDDDVKVGDLAVWWRFHQDGKAGHIGIVSYVGTMGTGVWGFRCIEGNVGDFPAPVREVDHHFQEDRILGFIRVPNPEGWDDE